MEVSGDWAFKHWCSVSLELGLDDQQQVEYVDVGVDASQVDDPSVGEQIDVVDVAVDRWSIGGFRYGAPNRIDLGNQFGWETDLAPTVTAIGALTREDLR